MRFIKKIGFFSALILPFLLVSGYYLGGINRWLIHIFVFIAVPLMDFIISTDTSNIPKEAVSQVAKERFYKLVTFFWVYIQLAILFWGFYVVATETLSAWEWVSLTTGMALITGGIGITVAHELGHKKGKLEQFYAKILLMTVCYMHFVIEHNRGHHVKVATPEDPATSRLGENFYAFWLRSVRDGYKSAWKLEREKLERKSIPFFSFKNEMIQFSLAPIIFIGVIFIGFSLALDRWVWEVPVFFFMQSFLAFSLLEAVNYLEHYGMERKLLADGRYERVTPIHSWNASHRVSNFLLFQLQRHSDHHAFAHKPYQVLNHYDESPQLPAGYSAMIILAFFPPVWFSIMNPRLEQWKEKTFQGSVQ
ncbi:alkane 1-monooxygenase [Algoriphagus kandeliae]|uniref:Alkane 1-monooxygenase n=1 Tax=Algoriphagus kandeliae TaxID=2562278 RepID=A0A4Y9R0W9_9BACT|nr:alkane 1-monooxygenase [Algoriphagus kandeliae]TFV97083.1 alkane 1-monooxygenase [Algoriphagus kandeliae]